MRTWLLILFALAAFVIAAEVLLVDEFTGRFNFVAVDYLIYPTEVHELVGGLSAATHPRGRRGRGSAPPLAR
jgi:hypothetical protein